MRVVSAKRKSPGWMAPLTLLLAMLIWLPSFHLFFWSDPQATAVALANRQVQLWTQPERRQGAIADMRRSNAEWDFMGRSYVAWALAQRALDHEIPTSDALNVIDSILEETLKIEEAEGFRFFLLPYAHRAPYLQQPDRSLFVDSEIALIIALRRQVADDRPDLKAIFQSRVAGMVERMSQAPVLHSESYPNECWMFDNATAAAAITWSDRLDGTDHQAFIKQWLERTKAHLVDAETGMLISSYQLDGKVLDGPEGSSIWMAIHALLWVDPDFAKQQYALARKELGRNILGFGFAREWPVSYRGPQDIDSGIVIPFLDASPSSSALAILAAARVGDQDFLEALVSSLNLGAFPMRDADGGIRYAASNQVGDAVLLYGLSQGKH